MGYPLRAIYAAPDRMIGGAQIAVLSTAVRYELVGLSATPMIELSPVRMVAILLSGRWTLRYMFVCSSES